MSLAGTNRSQGRLMDWELGISFVHLAVETAPSSPFAFPPQQRTPPVSISAQV
jgi:hypothetical protein